MREGSATLGQEELRAAARAFCRERPLYYTNFSRVLARADSRVWAAGPAGVALEDGPSRTFMLAAADEQAACRLVDCLPERADLFTVQGACLLEPLRRRFEEKIVQKYGEIKLEAYYQAVYPKDAPPAGGAGFTVRPMRPEEAEWAAGYYSAILGDTAYMARCIANGPMLVGEADGVPAGFIGWHPEGSMGLLEVLPAYRRRGLAYALEAAAIAYDLARGCRPYAHIYTGNAASLALQKKLGMVWDEEPLYWLP